LLGSLKLFQLVQWTFSFVLLKLNRVELGPDASTLVFGYIWLLWIAFCLGLCNG